MSETIPLTGQIDLLPVVRFEPWDYVDNVDPYWKNLSTEFIPLEEDKRTLFWERCMATAGITGLEPASIIDWDVLVDDLTSPVVLRKLIAVTSSESDDFPELADKEVFHFIMGGYILSYQGKHIIRTQCCSDLAVIEDWKGIAAYRSGEWGWHWIGHPGLPTRFDGDVLIFSSPSDNIPPPPSSSFYAVSPQLLEAAICEAETKLEAFHRRLIRLR